MSVTHPNLVSQHSPCRDSWLAAIVSQTTRLGRLLARWHAITRSLAEVKAELASLRKKVSARFAALAPATYEGFPTQCEGRPLEHPYQGFESLPDCYGEKSPLELALEMCERVTFLKKHIATLKTRLAKTQQDRDYLRDKELELALALPVFWGRIAGIAAYRDALRDIPITKETLQLAILAGMTAENKAAAGVPVVWDSSIDERQRGIDSILARLNRDKGCFWQWEQLKCQPVTRIPSNQRVTRRSRVTDDVWLGFSHCTECGEGFVDKAGIPQITESAFCGGDCKRAWLAKHPPACLRPVEWLAPASVAAVDANRQALQQLKEKHTDPSRGNDLGRLTNWLPSLDESGLHWVGMYVQENGKPRAEVKREKTLEEHCAEFNAKKARNRTSRRPQGRMGLNRVEDAAIARIDAQRARKYSPEAFDLEILRSRGDVTKDAICQFSKDHAHRLKKYRVH